MISAVEGTAAVKRGDRYVASQTKPANRIRAMNGGPDGPRQAMADRHRSVPNSQAKNKCSDPLQYSSFRTHPILVTCNGLRWARMAMIFGATIGY